MYQPLTVSATAPGKVILFGEHAVVYGQPAIAAPLTQLRALATIEPAPGRGVRLLAPDLKLQRTLNEADPQDPFALAVRLVREQAGLQEMPGCLITVTSEIPIASGLGSGAAITAAIIRALVLFLGMESMASPQWISDLTFEVEKIHHGTPSGIDNTVVAYEMPVFFQRRLPQNLIETFVVQRPLRLLVGDTGISSSTKVVVGDVRRRWQNDPEYFASLFQSCGAISLAARTAIKQGELQQLGRLMDRNHALLVQMTVSSPELDRLVAAALSAGALGAKMSGGGRGGNMIALVTSAVEDGVRAALLAAGARRVLHSTVTARPAVHD